MAQAKLSIFSPHTELKHLLSFFFVIFRLRVPSFLLRAAAQNAGHEKSPRTRRPVLIAAAADQHGPGQGLNVDLGQVFRGDFHVDGARRTNESLTYLTRVSGRRGHGEQGEYRAAQLGLSARETQVALLQVGVLSHDAFVHLRLNVGKFLQIQAALKMYTSILFTQVKHLKCAGCG